MWHLPARGRTSGLASPGVPSTAQHRCPRAVRAHMFGMLLRFPVKPSAVEMDYLDRLALAHAQRTGQTFAVARRIVDAISIVAAKRRLDVDDDAVEELF